MDASLKPSRLVVAGLIGILLVAPWRVSVYAAPAAGDVVPGQYIAVFHDWVGKPGEEADALAARHGLDLLFVYEHALKGFAARMPPGRLDALRRDPRIRFVGEDRVVAIAQQTLPTGVDRVEADQSSTQAGDGAGTVDVAVAIIDTGIDPRHPDLNVAGGYNCTTRAKNRWADDHGHGTHVAGIVGAKDNDLGVVGVAPGARLYAVKVLNKDGFGTWSTVICGIDYVTNNGPGTPLNIGVANMSLGGVGYDDGYCGLLNWDMLHLAICISVMYNITYVVAAGNDNKDFSGFVPAAYDEVLTATAMADSDGKPGGVGGLLACRKDVQYDDSPANFSNFALVGTGDEGHTLAAPGVCILSTWKDGGYNTISGTSMAAPHIAGAAALCLAGPCAGLTPDLVMARLRADAAAQPATYGFVDDPNSPNGSRYYGYLVYTGDY